MIMCWSDIFISIIQLATVILVGYLAYRYALKQMSRESYESIERKKYEAILQSHTRIYQLLAYTTDTENPKSIIIWERKSEINSDKVFYFRKDNAKSFLEALPVIFYQDGSGLFLSKEVSELFFEYRSIVYGLLLATKTNEENKVEVLKPELVARLKSIHQELSVSIRQNINLNERILSKR